MAFDRGELSVQAKIKLRLRDIVPPPGVELSPSGSVMLETTLGRALFNEALPDDYAYADYEVGKKQLGQIVNDLAERYQDRKSTRLNSSHANISYAVFCLKKKNINT